MLGFLKKHRETPRPNEAELNLNSTEKSVTLVFEDEEDYQYFCDLVSALDYNSSSSPERLLIRGLEHQLKEQL